MVRWTDDVNKGKSEVFIVESDDNTMSRGVTLFLSLGSFTSSLLFLSQNITGNVVGNFSANGANWLGGALFILSVITALIYVQESKK